MKESRGWHSKADYRGFILSAMCQGTSLRVSVPPPFILWLTLGSKMAAWSTNSHRLYVGVLRMEDWCGAHVSHLLKWFMDVPPSNFTGPSLQGSYEIYVKGAHCCPE